MTEDLIILIMTSLGFDYDREHSTDTILEFKSTILNYTWKLSELFTTNLSNVGAGIYQAGLNTTK